MRLSPALAGMRAYPFTRLTEAKRDLVARGVEVLDFGMGEPREETPAFIREALAAAIEPRSGYPLAVALREAGGLEVAPKQAWTPVAELTAEGIAAVNFGPGAPAQAHRRDESVEIAALVRAYRVLEAFAGAAA